MVLLSSKSLKIAYGLIDLVSPILTFLLLLLIFYSIYRKKRSAVPHHKYLFISFLLKMFGNFLTALLYGVYYGYGDTFGYFVHTDKLYTKFIENPLSFFSVFSSVPEPIATMKVYNVSFIFSIFTGNSYLANSLLFTTLSVIGGWLVYLVFIDMYPNVKKGTCLLYSIYTIYLVLGQWFTERVIDGFWHWDHPVFVLQSFFLRESLFIYFYYP